MGAPGGPPSSRTKVRPRPGRSTARPDGSDGVQGGRSSTTAPAALGGLDGDDLDPEEVAVDLVRAALARRCANQRLAEG